MALQVNINWEQLEKIPLRNKAVGLVVACLLIGGLFFYFLYLPEQKRLDQLKQKQAQVQRSYNEKKAIADNLPTFQEEVRSLNQKLETALTKLPNEAEIDKLLVDIPNLAKEEELSVVSFRPGGPSKQGFYHVIPLSLKLEGSYNRLARFFEKVGRLNRIITVGNIALTSPKLDETRVVLSADVQASTYTFVKENPKPGAQ